MVVYGSGLNKYVLKAQDIKIKQGRILFPPHIFPKYHFHPNISNLIDKIHLLKINKWAYRVRTPVPAQMYNVLYQLS
jgi:hypothetical protein